MCTVTYLPTGQGFILTHNRDEAPARSAPRIIRETRTTGALLFPKDAKAGGTWIAASKEPRVACLLNGAFIKHRHQPPYRRSRGLLLLDFFDWPNPDAFFEQYDLHDIEPFTFLYFAPDQIVEFRWDGQTRHLAALPPEAPHFWCSATLYPSDMQVRREQVFQQWLQRQPSDAARNRPANILRLHRTGSVGDLENDYVMNRENRVRTVSITQVVQRGRGLRMRYWDLLEGNSDVKQMLVTTRM